MGNLAVLVVLTVGWYFAGPGFAVQGRTEQRAEVVRQGSSVRTDHRARRVQQVRVQQRPVDCNDGMDRCNRAPGFVTPGIQYHDIRPSLGMGY